MRPQLLQRHAGAHRYRIADHVQRVGADKVANYREVRIGRQVGGLRIIEEGLSEGESVVVNGLQRVRPGTPVTPTAVPMEKADQAVTSSPQPAAS